MQSNGGLQACFKCEGKGFCHTSIMDHDKNPHERCFFCTDCDGCRGSGAIQGGQTTSTRISVSDMGMSIPCGLPVVPARAQCFKCEGKGFCHLSSMDHDA